MNKLYIYFTIIFYAFGTINSGVVFSNNSCLAPNTGIQFVDTITKPTISRKPSEVNLEFSSSLPKQNIQKAIKRSIEPYLEKLCEFFEFIHFEKGNECSFSPNMDQEVLTITLTATNKPKFTQTQLNSLLEEIIPELEKGLNSPEQLTEQLEKELLKPISYTFKDSSIDRKNFDHKLNIGEKLEGKKITNHEILKREQNVLKILNLKPGETLIEFGPGFGGRKGNIAIYAALKGLDVTIVDNSIENIGKIKTEESKIANLIQLAGGSIHYICGDINEELLSQNLLDLSKEKGGYDHIVALNLINSSTDKNIIKESNNVTDYMTVLEFMVKIKKANCGSIYFSDADEYVAGRETLDGRLKYKYQETIAVKELKSLLSKNNKKIQRVNSVSTFASLGIKAAKIFTFSVDKTKQDKTPDLKELLNQVKPPVIGTELDNANIHSMIDQSTQIINAIMESNDEESEEMIRMMIEIIDEMNVGGMNNKLSKLKEDLQIMLANKNSSKKAIEASNTQLGVINGLSKNSDLVKFTDENASEKFAQKAEIEESDIKFILGMSAYEKQAGDFLAQLLSKFSINILEDDFI